MAAAGRAVGSDLTMSKPTSGTGQPAVPAAVPTRWSARFFLVWIAILAGLELFVQSGAEKSFFLPAPSSVAVSLGQMIADGTLAPHLTATLTRIVLGLLVGAGLGVLLGLAMGTSRRLRRVIDPLVAAIHPVPRLAFFPLLIVVLGVGETSKLAAVSMGAFFPMLLNTVAGVRGMNPVHLELARNYGATRRQMFLHVLLPGSMPLMLTGLRLSANVAFHSTIGVEMVGSRLGIGSLLWLSWQTFRIDHLYAILVIIAAIGIGLASLIRWVTQRSAPWMTDTTPSAA
ncbi:MAG: taurine ABC transporter permease [Gemmatimonadetes bacterium]|nr:MAG: taurine ABC transporter permease [Gemmatimonadota bacterium]